MVPTYEDSIELKKSAEYSVTCQTCVMEYFAKVAIIRCSTGT